MQEYMWFPVLCTDLPNTKQCTMASNTCVPLFIWALSRAFCCDLDPLNACPTSVQYLRSLDFHYMLIVLKQGRSTMYKPQRNVMHTRANVNI